MSKDYLPKPKDTKGINLAALKEALAELATKSKSEQIAELKALLPNLKKTLDSLDGCGIRNDLNQNLSEDEQKTEREKIVLICNLVEKTLKEVEESTKKINPQTLFGNTQSNTPNTPQPNSSVQQEPTR